MPSIPEAAAPYGAYLAGLPRAALGHGRTFAFAGERHPYLYRRRNKTWLNERAVEVPIAVAALERNAGRRVLEVGNVLTQYGHGGHAVVDKYERAEGVRNIDVLDLPPDERYDLIVSLSTIEHVGVDDPPPDPSRAVRALALLLERLEPGGELLVTIPVGYNPVLDRALVAGEVEGLGVRALRRTRVGPHWREEAPEDVLGLPYDQRVKSAVGLLVASGRAASQPPEAGTGPSERLRST